MNSKVNISKIDKNSYTIISRAQTFGALVHSSLSYSDLKFIEIFTAKFDRHNPNNRTVRVSIKEIERSLNITRIHINDLMQRLDRLVSPFSITYSDTVSKEICFLDSFVIEKNEDNELFYVTMTCSKEANRYFYNGKNAVLSNFYLDCLLSFHSRYSYFLYLNLLKTYLVLKNKNGNSREINYTYPLENVKAFIGCSSERYKEFKHFNAEILKKSISDINENSNLFVACLPVRRGKKIVNLEFSIKLHSEACF